MFWNRIEQKFCLAKIQTCSNKLILNKSNSSHNIKKKKIFLPRELYIRFIYCRGRKYNSQNSFENYGEISGMYVYDDITRRLYCYGYMYIEDNFFMII